jgi:hypothetical protein
MHSEKQQKGLIMNKPVSHTSEEWEVRFEEKFNSPSAALTTIANDYPSAIPSLIQSLKSFIRKVRKEAILETLNKIDSFNLVEECQPDCTPEEHAYHEGTWKAHLKLESKLRKLKEDYD